LLAFAALLTGGRVDVDVGVLFGVRVLVNAVID
jgi:hypothetical protein